MSATTQFHVTVGCESVGQSPTYHGMWAIAGIFSACRIGHTVHTPNSYAALQRRNAEWTPMSDAEWARWSNGESPMTTAKLFAHAERTVAREIEEDMYPPEPYPWLTDEEIMRQNERRAVEIWES